MSAVGLSGRWAWNRELRVTDYSGEEILLDTQSTNLDFSEISERFH